MINSHTFYTYRTGGNSWNVPCALQLTSAGYSCCPVPPATRCSPSSDCSRSTVVRHPQKYQSEPEEKMKKIFKIELVRNKVIYISLGNLVSGIEMIGTPFVRILRNPLRNLFRCVGRIWKLDRPTLSNPGSASEVIVLYNALYKYRRLWRKL